MDIEQQSHLYLLLGEIKATQTAILAKMDEHSAERKVLSDRVSRLETRINRAAGALAVLIFIFQYGWNYFVGKA